MKLIKIKDAWVNPDSIDAISPVYHGIPHVVVVVKGEPVGLLFDPEQDGSPAELAATIAERLQFADMNMDDGDYNTATTTVRSAVLTDDQLDLIESSARAMLKSDFNFPIQLHRMFESLIPEAYAMIIGEFKDAAAAEDMEAEDGRQ